MRSRFGLVPQVIDEFVMLFRGRGDCYGSWDGGCVRNPLRHEQFAKHLAEGPYIGVYPAFNMDGNTVCIWGCTDIDKTDDPKAAHLIRDAFKAVGVTAWIERSAHGFHVWVFANELVSAQSMRRMFLAAHQVVGVPPTEVNPKQEKLLGQQVGNYVRLPYPGVLSKGIWQRYMVDTLGQSVDVERFVAEALAARTSKADIERLAAKYRPPQRTVQIGGSLPSLGAAEAARALDAFGYVIFRDGPQGHRDRSTALMMLAHRALDNGLSPESAFELLKDADARWGKFSSRGDSGMIELEKLVFQVYGLTPST